MWVNLFTLIFHFFPVEAEAALPPQEWLSLYQYEKTWLGWKSDIQNPQFYFSQNGFNDPQQEWLAAIAAFKNPEPKWGTQNDYPGCVFPARLQRLEEILKITFPKQECSDFKNWFNRINANRVSIVYSGAYIQNPASVLGHIFLRFWNSERDESQREGLSLLNYAVGYTAAPDPSDSKPLYVIKGLLGFYPGYYSIEPYYNKVGLYNNSESRDLWDWEINLSSDQVSFLLKHLWELTFNSETPYYFFKKNCGFRLQTFLNTVESDFFYNSESRLITLPTRVIKDIDAMGLIQNEPRFRASAQRKMGFVFSQFDANQKRKFKSARTDLEAINQIQDPKVLDLLIDHWTYENYQKQTQLNPKEAQLYQRTLEQRSSLGRPLALPSSDQQIRLKQKLQSPHLGHYESWLKFIFEGDQKSQYHLGVEIQFGFHQIGQNSVGYDDLSNLEFLKFKIIPAADQSWNWALKVFEITHLPEFDELSHRFSWRLNTSLEREQPMMKNSTLIQKAGIGLTKKWHHWTFSPLASALHHFEFQNSNSLWRPGLTLISVFNTKDWGFNHFFELHHGAHHSLLESVTCLNFHSGYNSELALCHKYWKSDDDLEIQKLDLSWTRYF